MKTNLELKAKKVDTLKHLTDHGFSFESTDPKVKALFEQLKSLEYGKAVITAAKSELIVYRSGNLTLFKLKLSSHKLREESEWKIPDSNSVYMRECSISYAGKAIQCAFGNLFWETIKASIFEGEIPRRITSTEYGETLDKVKRWIQNGGAFALAGESGIRTYFRKLALKSSPFGGDYYQSKLLSEKITILEKNSDVTQIERELKNKDSELQALENKNDLSLKRFNECLLSNPMPNWVNEYASQFIYSGQHYPNPLYSGIKATPARYSHEELFHNYTLRVEGEKITCSSNAKIPFSFSEVKEALKTRFNGLSTQYGKAVILEARRGDLPYCLVQVGCHRLDLAQIGIEIEPLHKISIIPESPAILWEDNALGVLKHIRDRWGSVYHEQKAKILSVKIQKRKELKTIKSQIESGHRLLEIEQKKKELSDVQKACKEAAEKIENEKKEIEELENNWKSLLKIQTFKA